MKGLYATKMNDDLIRQDTPFLRQPLLDLVGRVGTGSAAAKILSGTFQVPVEGDEWAARLIPHLARVPGVTVADVRLPESSVTLQSHQQGWARAKEKTSSGPSGITFAHFKAGTKDPLIAEYEALMTSILY